MIVPQRFQSQIIKVFDESSPPFFDIVGVCVDPLNNGKVVYMPLDELSTELGQDRHNLLFLKIDTTEKSQAISKIENEISGEKWNIVELGQILDKHVTFLNNI